MCKNILIMLLILPLLACSDSSTVSTASVNFEQCRQNSYCEELELQKMSSLADYDVYLQYAGLFNVMNVERMEMINPIDYSAVNIKECADIKNPVLASRCQYAAKINSGEITNCDSEQDKIEVEVGGESESVTLSFSPKTNCLIQLLHYKPEFEVCEKFSDNKSEKEACVDALVFATKDKQLCNSVADQALKQHCNTLLLTDLSHCKEASCVDEFEFIHGLNANVMNSLDCSVISNENAEALKACESLVAKHQAMEKIDISLCLDRKCVGAIVDKYIYLNSKEVSDEPEAAADKLCSDLDSKGKQQFCRAGFFSRLAVYTNDISFCADDDLSDPKCLSILLADSNITDLSLCETVGQYDIKNQKFLQKQCRRIIGKNKAADVMDFGLCQGDYYCEKKVYEAIYQVKPYDVSRCETFSDDYDVSKCKEKITQQQAIDTGDLSVCASIDCIKEALVNFEGSIDCSQLDGLKDTLGNTDLAEMQAECSDFVLLKNKGDNLVLAECIEFNNVDSNCIKVYVDSKQPDQLDFNECDVMFFEEEAENIGSQHYCKAQMAYKKQDLAGCFATQCIINFFNLNIYSDERLDEIDCNVIPLENMTGNGQSMRKECERIVSSKRAVLYSDVTGCKDDSCVDKILNNISENAAPKILINQLSLTNDEKKYFWDAEDLDSFFSYSAKFKSQTLDQLKSDSVFVQLANETQEKIIQLWQANEVENIQCEKIDGTVFTFFWKKPIRQYCLEKKSSLLAYKNSDIRLCGDGRCINEFFNHFPINTLDCSEINEKFTDAHNKESIKDYCIEVKAKKSQQ